MLILLLSLLSCTTAHPPTTAEGELDPAPSTAQDAPAIPFEGYHVAGFDDQRGPFTNRLTLATSPYLLLHKNNPVDWYAWGDEAFAEAKRRNVPVFISIGYTACHWCHVMEHESFADPVVAAYMNENFVNIKVDREERPDVDGVYMDAIHLLNGSGGWPASIWMNHDREPFFAGTYYPKHSRYGRQGFMEVLTMLDDKWRNDNGSLQDVASQVTSRLVRQALIVPTTELKNDAPKQGAMALNKSWDKVNAGWGAKKFPMLSRLEFLLAYGQEHNDAQSLNLVRSTLDAMDKGGIHDHLGGGFHRYTVDPKWIVPHFEKMTYDNGQFLRIYAEAAVALKNPRYAAVARGIADYMIRDMRHAEGAFYSSQDADSGGVEGTFYVWTKKQVHKLLSKDEAEAFISAYQITDEGNFEHHTTVLTRSHNASPSSLTTSRETLRVARESRVHPPTDTKRVVAYNALMISGLARAGRLLDEPGYTKAAEQCASAVLKVRATDGAFPRTLEPGSPLAVIDDYALLAEALLDLFEATGDSRWLTDADSVAATMTERFWDPLEHGFFFSDAMTPGLLVRQKDYTDGARPSGAARAVSVLSRLRAYGTPAGDGEKIQQGLEAAGLYLDRSPASVPTLLTVLDGVQRSSMEVIVITPLGRRTDAVPFETVFNSAFRPHAVLGVSEGQVAEDSMIGAFKGKVPAESGALAYVCFDGTCKQPVETPAALVTAMSERPTR